MLAYRKLNASIHAPVRKTAGSGRYDVAARSSLTIAVGDREVVGTGLSVAIPDGHVGLLKTRSSMARCGVDVVGGVIDADYRGEVKVILHNAGRRAYAVTTGDRIAQLVVLPVFTGDAVKVEELPTTKRGADGFGSTGR